MAAFDMNDTSQFDLARKRAAQQSAGDLQVKKDTLARRFASLGNLDSGARLKQENLAEDAVQKNLANTNEGIQAQQNQEMQRRGEILQGQQFASGEAQKGRDFSAAQAGLGRQFQTSERLGSQGFASGESKLGRDLQASQFDKNYALQGRGLDMQAARDKEGVAQWDLNFGMQKDRARAQDAAQAEGIKQWDLSHALEADAQAFNVRQAEKAGGPNGIESFFLKTNPWLDTSNKITSGKLDGGMSASGLFNSLTKMWG